MHPILFRIPLPAMALKLWWALAAVAAIAALYAILGLRRKDRGSAGVALVIGLGAGVAGYVFRETKFEAANLPIYSYGVMLGLSLVVGWYLTLTLAERDGLPKETMANCYVITAIAAILGSRILYVVTNPDEFKQASDFFALRRGGLVAYGGFLGGYLGSWLYLRSQRSGCCRGRTSRCPALRRVCSSPASAATCSAATSASASPRPRPRR